MPSHLTALPGGMDGLQFDGRVYALDRLPDSHLLKATLPRFREAYPLVDESRWGEIDLIDTFDPPMLNQVQNGCVGHGGSTAFTVAWEASGQDVPEGGFSPTWAYAGINGGRDQGATIGDLIDWLQKAGMATANTFPESKYMLGGPAERAARPEALQYLLDDAYQIQTWEELGTALHMGYPVARSIMVGSDFTHLDADGYVPVDRGMGNHCTMAGGIRRLKGKVGIKDRNSWGPTFGLDGNYFSGRDHVLSQGNGFSGVVFRTVRRKPGTPTPPVIV